MATYSYVSTSPSVSDNINGITFYRGVKVNYVEDQLELNQFVPERLDRYVDNVKTNDNLVTPFVLTEQEKAKIASVVGDVEGNAPYDDSAVVKFATTPVAKPAGTLIKNAGTGLVIGQADGADQTVLLAVGNVVKASTPVAQPVGTLVTNAGLIVGQADGSGNTVPFAGGDVRSATSAVGQDAGTLITDPVSGLILGQADGVGNVVAMEPSNVPFGPITTSTTISGTPTKFLSIICNVAGTFTVRNGAHTVGTAVPGFTSISMVPADVARTLHFPIDLVNGFGLDVSGGGSFSGLMR